jgi:predicted DNA-binding protein (MmcQ/YjbR family)
MFNWLRRLFRKKDKRKAAEATEGTDSVFEGKADEEQNLAEHENQHLDEDKAAFTALGEEKDLSEAEIEAIQKEDAAAEVKYAGAGLAGEEQAAEKGLVVIDEETKRFFEELEKERQAYIEAKKKGAPAEVPLLHFTLSREDVVDYVFNTIGNTKRYPVPQKIVFKKSKHSCDALYCGAWCFGMVHEHGHVIRLTLRMTEELAARLNEKYTSFKPAAFLKGDNWYDLIVDASFGSKKEVYEILNDCYDTILNRYYQSEKDKYITDTEAAGADAKLVDANMEEHALMPDEAFELAMSEYMAALQKFKRKYKLTFHMTRQRAILYAETKLGENGEVIERSEKRWLPASLNAGGKTYALVYEKAYLESATGKKGKINYAEEMKAGNLKVAVSLTVRISDAYAEWLALRHPEVRRARFPKNRNWYVVPVGGSFPNAEMVYRVLRHAKAFVTK